MSGVKYFECSLTIFIFQNLMKEKRKFSIFGYFLQAYLYKY